MSVFIRGFILPVVVASALASAPALSALVTRTYAFAGTVSSVCRIGTSTTYLVSISVAASGGQTRITTISLDGTAGNAQATDSLTTSVTKIYTEICNQPTAQTLTLSTPKAAKTANANLAYSFIVKDGSGATVATATTQPGTNAITLPARSTANYTITASATNINSTPVGTYTASVTLLTGP